MIENAKLALLLVVAVGLAGCGGGGGRGPDPPGIMPIPNPVELLRGAGLTCAIESDKDVYQNGEIVRFWLSVRNDGSHVRTLELHHPYDVEAADTYDFAVWGAENPWGGATWGQLHYGVLTWVVQPGETVTPLSSAWNQTTTDGGPVNAGSHRLDIRLTDLLVDGKPLWKYDTFEVVFSKGIVIQQ